jgi:hypothetical protein
LSQSPKHYCGFCCIATVRVWGVLSSLIRRQDLFAGEHKIDAT